MDGKILAYVELLLKWQKKINLISAGTIDDIQKRHIDDSLQLQKFIPPGTKSIIDIGTGAGLPGIPLCIATGIKTYLIESDRRKSVFLNEVVRTLKLDAVVINQRAETAVVADLRAPVVITARAIKELAELLAIIHPFLENNKIEAYRLILMKGRNVSRETEKAQKTWAFEVVYEQSETDPAASILIVDKLKKGN